VVAGSENDTIYCFNGGSSGLADVLWTFDIHKQVDSYPHDSAHASFLLLGNHLYINTGNGVDNTHLTIRRPEAPSLIVLDKRDGHLVARDVEGIGPKPVDGLCRKGDQPASLNELCRCVNLFTI